MGKKLIILFCQQVVCGVGYHSNPVNGDNTVQQSMQTTLRQSGVIDESLRQDIERELRSASERLMQSIIDYCCQLELIDRGSRRAQPDLIGVDFIGNAFFLIGLYELLGLSSGCRL